MHLNEETLNELLDDALEARARAEAEAHVENCPQCAARLAELRTLFATLEALPATPLTRDLSASVVSALAPTAPPLSVPVRVILAAQALIGVLVLAFTVPMFFSALPSLSPAQLLPAFSFDWASLLQPLTQLWAQSQSLARTATSPLTEISLWMWGAALGGLAVLWLVGNGAVLRFIFSTRSHSWKN